jgi:hypothetical protein
MQKIKSICDLCNREFDKPVGLTIHQRTCKTKAAEKEKDEQYERQLEEREQERRGMIPNLTCLTQFSDFSDCTTKSDAAQAARISDQPRRVRAWEDPKLRGKAPVRTLAAKTGEM